MMARLLPLPRKPSGLRSGNKVLFSGRCSNGPDTGSPVGNARGLRSGAAGNQRRASVRTRPLRDHPSLTELFGRTTNWCA